MIKRFPSSDPKTSVVRFELPPTIWADCVNLVGEFNQWSRDSHPMVRDRSDGTWYIVVELERNKEYQFRYLVNGRDWHNDWNADRYVANGFGGTNSVILT